jgi:hypothetical protein
MIAQAWTLVPQSTLKPTEQVKKLFAIVVLFDTDMTAFQELLLVIP